jgi:hypothetical protein
VNRRGSVELAGAKKGSTVVLDGAQHLAARRRAEEIAGHLDHGAVLNDLGRNAEPVDEDRWRAAIGDAVVARSREQAARAVARSLRTSTAGSDGGDGPPLLRPDLRVARRNSPHPRSRARLLPFDGRRRRPKTHPGLDRRA